MADLLGVKNPGLPSTQPGRGGQPINFDPAWLNIDRLQRLTVSEQKIRAAVRDEIVSVLAEIRAVAAELKELKEALAEQGLEV